MTAEQRTRQVGSDAAEGPFAVASACLPDGTRELVTIHYRSERDAEADARRAAAVRRGERAEARP